MYATDNTTFISGVGLAFCLLMGMLMLVLPRRHALLPVVAMVCYMTMGQRVMVLGLNFTLIRILLLFGFMRVVFRGEVQSGPFNRIDRMMLWWVLSSIVTYTILWKTSEAFVNRLGLAYDALGLYFIFRVLVRDIDDMRAVMRQFAWLVIPLALFMLIEKGTGRNPFAALGGVPPETIEREGVLRCQGPFAHPILAGAFATALLPLFVGLWWQNTNRFLALVGMVSAAIIAATSGSSGPLMAASAGIVGLWMWPLRKSMRGVRWTLGLTLLGLHLAMAAPVWFLLARVGIFGGSTGYHRAILIDHAVHNFFEWWLVGTYSTAHWGYYMFDVTNQYVLIGVQGGLITLILFVTIIVRCFSAVGRAVQEFGDEHRVEQKLVWALGASLVVHAFNYISVPYFDQNIVNWYLLLAMIATAGQMPKTALQPQPSPGDAGSAASGAGFALPMHATHGFNTPHRAT
jgi:hypothetical protein